MLNRTMAMITTSSMKPTRHDRYVVTKPPSKGPIDAPTAAAAPTKAYVLFMTAPSKLPWMSDCIAGSSREAPRPPMIAQKITIAVTDWVSVIANAPMA